MERIVRLVAIALLTAFMLGVAAPAFAIDGAVCPPPPPPTCGDCKTPGYWKNHPDAWPVTSLHVGGHTYTEAQLIELIGTPPQGDVSYILFRALVAAKLNVLIGCKDSTIGCTISQADSWLCLHHLGYGIDGGSDAWCVGEPLAEELDAFNNK